MGMQDRFDGPSGGTAADWAADEALRGDSHDRYLDVNPKPSATGTWRGVLYVGYGFRREEVGRTAGLYESKVAAEWAANALKADLPLEVWSAAREE